MNYIFQGCRHGLIVLMLKRLPFPPPHNLKPKAEAVRIERTSLLRKSVLLEDLLFGTS